MKNIILIGMPGSGKSTIGVLIAKRLGYDFIDTDIVIQNKTGELLCETLEKFGVNGLLDKEQQAIEGLNLTERPCVIATGGSAVLRESSMLYLKSNGVCVYLKLPYEAIARRVKNRKTRGIAAENHETLLDIYNYRLPYYEKYADITINCDKNKPDKNVTDIISILSSDVN